MSKPDPTEKLTASPLARTLLVGGSAGGATVGGILIGVLATANKEDLAALLRAVVAELKGPFGGLIFLALALSLLSWHHLRRVTHYEGLLAEKDELIADARAEGREANEARNEDLARIAEQYRLALVGLAERDRDKEEE